MAVGRMDMKHMFRYPNIKRVKSGKKYQKAINWYIDLIKREKKEGLTKRINNAQIQCTGRLKKYGIVTRNINKILERRGLEQIEAF